MNDDQLRMAMRANANMLDVLAGRLITACGMTPLSEIERAEYIRLEACIVDGQYSSHELSEYMTMKPRSRDVWAIDRHISARMAEIRTLLPSDHTGDIFDAIVRALTDGREAWSHVDALMRAAKAITGSDEDDPDVMAELLRGSVGALRDREVAEADAWAERQARQDAEVQLARFRSRAPVQDGDPELAVYTIGRGHAYCQAKGLSRIRDTHTYERGHRGVRVKLNHGPATAINNLASALGMSAWDVLDEIGVMP